jgi:hypothetical protein
LSDVLFLHTVLRPHLDLVHDLDQQIDQPIGNLLGAQHTESSQQGEAHGGVVRAQARWLFHDGTVAIDLQHFVGNTREQVSGKRELSNAPELGHLL